MASHPCFTEILQLIYCYLSHSFFQFSSCKNDHVNLLNTNTTTAAATAAAAAAVFDCNVNAVDSVVSTDASEHM